MKLINSLLLALSLPVTVLSSQSPLTASALEDPVEVPGDSNLTYCQDPKDYILGIEYINLSPNPPEKQVPLPGGKNLTIEAAFASSQIIDVGAKIYVQVKLGYITLLRQEYDFCESIDAVNLTCPVEEGARRIVKKVEIPGVIPSGTYTVFADAYTAEHEQEITCLQGSIVF